MFVHHVFFWMNPDPSPAERVQLATGINTLKTVEVVQTFHLGIPAGTNRAVIDSSYDFSLLLIFNTAEDEAHYQTHPTHLKFIDDCKHLWQKVLIYDSVDG